MDDALDAGGDLTWVFLNVMSNAMAHYTKLWSHIVNSTIWSEDDHTRLVWITMLAISDMGGYVAGSIPGLAHLARVPIPSCEKALITLKSPDLYSRTKENEGRRIQEVDGGWHILNYEKHREAAAEENRRIQNRERQRKFRDKRKESSGNKITRDVRDGYAMSLQASSASSSASEVLHTSCAMSRVIFAKHGMDDGGWRKIEEKIKNPAEAMLLVEQSAKKRNPPGWIVDHICNGYTSPATVPQSSLSKWANESGIVKSICGHEFTGRVKHSTKEIILTVGDANHTREVRIPFSELKPESIVFEFKESL